MKLPFSNLFKRSVINPQATIAPIDQVVPLIIGSALGDTNVYTNQNAESLSMVYTCTKILSETIARLPIGVYTDSVEEGKILQREDPLFYLLHYQPAPSINHYNFFSTLECHRNLQGNAFAYIHRERGLPAKLEIVPPSRVYSYKWVGDEVYYDLAIRGPKPGQYLRLKNVNQSDVLHFRHITKDGIWGITPLTALRLNLSTTYKGLQTIDKFYENNAASPKAIKMPLVNNKNFDEALKKFEAESSGPQNAGRMMRIPPGSEIVDLQLNFADAEFIATINFNTSQIAAAFGVPPHLLGLLDYSKFNNVEYMQLNFKINTVAPILRMYREEMETKLLLTDDLVAGKSIEFNSASLVETDYKNKIDGLAKEISYGMITPNEAARIQGYSSGFEGGDYHYIQSGFVPMEKLEEFSNTKYVNPKPDQNI